MKRWLLGGAVSCVAAPALAAPLPADLPAGDVRVTAEVREGRTTFTLRRGPRALESWAAPGTLDDVTVEPASSAGRSVWVVRGRGPGLEIAAIADVRPRPRWVWHGRTDLHGDPGERVADALESRDFDADQRPDLLVGERREGVGACGEGPSLLFARALDAAGHLRPVQSVIRGEGMTPLTAETLAGEVPAPVVDGARFVVATSSAGGSGEAALLGPPTGLGDGRLDTGWAEGRGASGVGELVRGRWAGPPITAVVVRGGAAASLPRRLVLGVDDARFLVTIPPEAGEAARILLPAPARASCLHLVLADDGARGDDARIGFAEIAVFSSADGTGGLGALVDLLVADAAEGDRAVGWLASSGPPAVDALSAAWERLGPRGRRRALRVADAVGRSGHGSAVREMRRTAAADDDADVRSDAISALARGDDDDTLALLAVALGEGAGAEGAARALADAVLPEPAWEVVRGLLPERTPWERPALRTALARGLAGNAAWQSALGTEPTPSTAALAGLALAVADSAPSDARDALVRSLIERALTTDVVAAPFEDRFRLARAGREGSSPTIDAWLERTARDSEEWMLRAEAVEALGPRASRELLAVLLRDPYPRVRLAAAHAVAARGGEAPTLLALARHDAWPLVREYAMEQVVDVPEGRTLTLEALADPASAMRRRALELLRTRQGADVVGPVAAILEDEREWPHVTARAIELAEARCEEDLGPSLVSVVERGARPAASAAALDNAQAALRVALRIGGSTATHARRAASAGPSVAVFGPLLERPATPCGGPGPEGGSRGVPSAP
jgi:hypothetical protein